MAVALLASLLLACAAASTAIYNQAPSTKLGCHCKSECTTSAMFNCDAASFCSVREKHCARGTASHSLYYGYYDYCVYEPDQNYEMLTAEEKRDIVLTHVNEDRTSGTYPSTIGVLTGLLGESVMTSFDASADVFPEKRTKYIHSVGVTGGIRFDSVGEHPYTGLFQGAKHGVIRLSSAKSPSSGGTAPGMGIKFFRDGRPSANFVAMYSLDGQPCTDKDFFAHDWHNHIPQTDNFGLKIVAAKFWQASMCPLQVGLSDLASEPEKPVKFPYELSFHSLVSSDCPCEDYAQCLSNLAKIGKDTTFFQVSATPSPGGQPTVIGNITLTSLLTTSRFGDEKLFFSHQRMEEDFALEPAWLEAIDPKNECGMSGVSTSAPSISDGCTNPFKTRTVDGIEMLDSDMEQSHSRPHTTCVAAMVVCVVCLWNTLF